MNVLHVLQNISGTTIPVEIATAISNLSNLTVRVVSRDPLPEKLPDTVRDDLVIQNLCVIDSYNNLIDKTEERFDIVHTHKLEPAAKIGYRTRNTEMCHVNTQHGHIHYDTEEKIKNVPGLLFADALVYNSASTAHSYNLIERICKFRPKEFVVHNGVNTDRINGYQASIEKPDTVVTAARLIPRKNLDALVQSLSHNENINLKIIGDGPERTPLENLARRLGIRSQIEFVGYLPKREDVYKEMETADIFVLPSHGEGFGVSVAEAMAVGLPVIVSNLPIFHEVVGENGYFVDRRSPEDIADKISKLISNPDIAREVGKENRKRIFESFSLLKCARSYHNVYNSILSRD